MSKTIEYVIAIKRIKDYYGKPIATENQPWYYPCQEYFNDDPIGYVWDSYNENTMTFVNELEASVWWDVLKSSLKPYINGYYDPDSLCIQKRTIMVETETIKKIQV